MRILTTLIVLVAVASAQADEPADVQNFDLSPPPGTISNQPHRRGSLLPGQVALLRHHVGHVLQT